MGEAENKIERIAKRIVSFPRVFTFINGIEFYIYSEKHCQHNEAHVHVIEVPDEETFSLRDGHPLEGKIKHENEVKKFLQDTSNRRRLLRRFNKYQETGMCTYLENPNMRV